MVTIKDILNSGIIVNEEYKNKTLTTMATDVFDDGTITYKMNEHGYRSQSLTIDCEYKILTLGCSWTMGIGVTNDKIWPSVINEHYKKKNNVSSSVFNYSIYGCSTSYIFKILYKILEGGFKPDMVLIMWPGFSRRDYIKENGHFKKIGGFRYAHDSDVVWRNEPEDKLFIELRNDNQDVMIFWESYKFVEILCKLYDVKIYHTIAGYYFDIFKNIDFGDTINWNNFFVPSSCYKNDMGARDKEHPSDKWHINFANNFFKFINNENSI